MTYREMRTVLRRIAHADRRLVVTLVTADPESGATYEIDLTRCATGAEVLD